MTPSKRPNPGMGLGLVGLLVASLAACTGAISGQATAAQVMGNTTSKAKFMSCDPTTNTATCLTTTVQTFGRKAFRRPLTTTEVTSFMRLNSLTPAGAPAQVAQAILAAFLASPSFIMLPEVNQTASGSG